MTNLYRNNYMYVVPFPHTIFMRNTTQSNVTYGEKKEKNGYFRKNTMKLCVMCSLVSK